ncbi:MAG TPA: glycosyltransferase family 9 protein [Candidatus Cybelea sp.]|nr:glycosyltransferase family 9 protein [Candidatus Cybelea sp.]
MPKVSPSVLIIRLDAIGDALALTPSIAALRRHGIAVDVVLRHSNANAFAPRAVREIVVAGFELRNATRSNVNAVERLGRDLRARQYTHVLVATEDLGGYRLAAAIGAPTRIGFEDPWTKPLKALWSRRVLTKSVYRSAKLTARSEHESATLFKLIAPLAGDEKPTADLAQLRPLVLESEPAPDDRVAVQITDKWQRLGITFESVVDLLRRLAASSELHLISSRGESAYARSVERATGIAVSYFDDLPPWKAAIAAAVALVAPDSGAVHVAGMTGTPVVAVFPPMRHYDAWVARWAPWASAYRVVRADEGWPVRAADALALLRSI